jgi:hypothetical protein
MTTMINNLTELAGTIGCNDSVAAIGRALFKGTDCGISFDGGPDYVSVCGYAEGADAECVPYKMHYPFSTAQFWACVQWADEEGCQLWHEWNDEDWGDVYPDDVMDDDNAQRAADMNATLNGGW